MPVEANINDGYVSDSSESPQTRDSDSDDD
jgi:hypothetical protein